MLQSLVLLLALGLVPALVFAWLYELTPEGLKRDAEVVREHSIAAETGRRMDRLILAGMLVLVAVIAADRYWPREPADRASLPAAVEAGSAPDAPAVPAASGAAAAPANSIAVLPFVNMSADAEQEYFADGISEEILNVLARTPELQVAARTSSFSFKDTEREISSIAEALKVRMVLEGSVRKQAQRVRITAQLIDAGTGYHLWSQTFDRDLSDIFAIQEEIAGAVASALKIELGSAPAPAESRDRARSIEAHDLYLQGLALWQTRLAEDLWRAVELFERATTADPKFAEAYAGKALVYAVLPDYSAKIGYETARRLARDKAERALALDATLPEPYVVLAYIATAELRRETAEALFLHAIELAPSFATAHQWRGTSLMAAGRLDDAMASLQRAQALDPRSRAVGNNLAFLFAASGRYRESMASCTRVLDFAPDHVACLDILSLTQLMADDLEGARATLQRRAALGKPRATGPSNELVDALRGRGNRDAVVARYATLPLASSNDPDGENTFYDMEIPALLALLGDHAAALAFLERLAAEDQSSNSLEWAMLLPPLDPIRCDPRFVALVAQAATVDPHHERVCGKSPPEKGARVNFRPIAVGDTKLSSGN